MSLKQKSSTVFPDLDRIKDPEIKQVFSDLFKVLQGSLTDSYDDSNQAARWEVDGTETQLVTADEVDMQSKKIINVTDPTAAQDASTKTYTDTKISKTTAAEISAMTEKTTLADGDHFLIEDSAASNAKKRVLKSTVAVDKISKTIAGEIAAMTEKTTLVDADLFLIEDSAAGNAKKKVQKSNISPVSTFMPTDIQVFTASGTWVKPSNISKVYVKVWGAGGGGANRDSNTISGGGGGGGGYSEGYVTVTGNVTVTVGTAGAAGAQANGGNSSFAGAVTVQGDGGSGATGITGAAGGAASGGQINLTGQTGQTGVTSVGQLGDGGMGGSSPFGGTGGAGGIANTQAVSTQPGQLPGGGGGGASNDDDDTSGEAGAAGLVIVYY